LVFDNGNNSNIILLLYIALDLETIIGKVFDFFNNVIIQFELLITTLLLLLLSFIKLESMISEVDPIVLSSSSLSVVASLFTSDIS